jgi:hypothetical protein
MKLYSINSPAPIEVSDVPIIVEGGMISEPIMCNVGETTFTTTISEKGKRKLFWSLGLTNNWRKRHGVPMYRKLER